MTRDRYTETYGKNAKIETRFDHLVNMDSDAARMHRSSAVSFAILAEVRSFLYLRIRSIGQVELERICIVTRNARSSNA